MDDFQLVKPDEVENLLKIMWPTASTWDLLVSNQVGLVSWVQEVKNAYLLQGVDLTTVKEAVVKHFFKKASLDLNHVSNYCLKDSTPFLGKVVAPELHVIWEETDHLSHLHLGPDLGWKQPWSPWLMKVTGGVSVCWISWNCQWLLVSSAMVSWDESWGSSCLGGFILLGLPTTEATMGVGGYYSALLACMLWGPAGTHLDPYETAKNVHQGIWSQVLTNFLWL